MRNLRVQANQDGIHVSLGGTDRLWALRKEVFLPADAIESVEVRPRGELRWWKAWLRAPGTFLPGVIRAGTYYGFGSKEFWSARNQQELLVIKTGGSKNPKGWTKVVLGVDDPHALADTLRREVVPGV